jgi:predicted DNA-binding transcriptional regulator YafY
MRADRLVAALLVLQARGQVTARSLAAELEISERTARRDLEALALAGLPVYSQAGRNGGWSLVGGARTDLSGLTASEVRALFLLSGPAGTTPELRNALRKLVRALPPAFRADAEAAATAVLVDPTGWDRARPRTPEHLGSLQQAVVDRARVRLGYQGRAGVASERPVDPLGLVNKRGVWYLVAGTEDGRRTFRVDRVRSVVATGERAERPQEFDLEATWAQSMGELDELRLPLTATANVAASVVAPLRAVLGTPVEVSRDLGAGRVEVRLRSYNAWTLARQLAGFGRHVELIGPDEVLAEMRRVAAELAASYLGPSSPPSPPGPPGPPGRRAGPAPSAPGSGAQRRPQF